MKPDGDFVDVDDYSRKQAIREAEYQQSADAGSKVLRVSTKTIYGPHRYLPGVVVYERVNR